MKTKEELKALKEEVETLNKKLAELTEEEVLQVTGGSEFIGKTDSEGEMFRCKNGHVYYADVAARLGMRCGICREKLE